MKYLKFLFIAAVLVLASCSGSKSYNPEVCQNLAEKIENSTEFTQDDYAEMIDQLVAASKLLQEKSKEIGDDQEKQKEFVAQEDNMKLAGYTMAFAMYLYSNQDKFSDDTKKKFEAAEKELKSMK
ncbi:MAG: hypothetical protein K2M11_08465 [Paramuribaculum sp.]|nr:hypothetical protein [Paramuribaculum sp.]